MTLEFDSNYYLTVNPDVRAAGIDALTHYQQYGAREGRDPNGYFDEAYYRYNNPDVNTAVNAGLLSSGYQHYMLYGNAEGRNPSALFNEAFYLRYNGDVAAAVQSGSFVSGYTHFLLYGQAEGRYPTSAFSESSYLAANPDVAAAVSAGAFASGWQHFALYGKFESHRSGIDSALFEDHSETPISNISTVDEAWYLSAYPDVDAAIKAGIYTSAQHHYANNGSAETRMSVNDPALAGNDSLTGTSAEDKMHGGAGNDTIDGFIAHDLLFGETGNDYLIGGAGYDTLNGGSGADTLDGGSGDDVYYIDEIGDQIIELISNGHDLVQSSISYVMSEAIEQLTLLGNDNLTGMGNESGNNIRGNVGNNELRGEGSSDRIYGNNGNDTIYGGEGTDGLYGEAGNDVLQDNDNNTRSEQTLDGGAGEDTLIGSGGDDRYYVDNSNDVVVDPSSVDSDTLETSASFDLPANIEQFNLTPTTESIIATGNEFNNTIGISENLSNVNIEINGLGGNDTIYARYGTIHGGTGDDTIITSPKAYTGVGTTGYASGQAPLSSIYGDEGQDTFTISPYRISIGTFSIMDFNAGEDVISVDSSQFYILTSFSSLLELTQNDTNGNAVITIGSQSIILVGVAKEDLVATDVTFS